MKLPVEIQDLAQAALQARLNSYSPYSKYKVGAAIRTKAGHLFSGCNVENSTYGATVCAERVAVQKAVSELGKVEVVDVVVVTDSSPPGTPCGICRQVISEFGAQATIHTINPQGEYMSFKMSELLPSPFLPSHLEKHT